MKKLFWALLWIPFLGLSSCSSKPDQPQGQSIAEKIPVQVVRVKKEPVPLVIVTSGPITPLREAVIRSRVAGRIQKVYVRVGQEVHSGEPLIQIDQEDFLREQRMRRYKEKIATTEKELQKAEFNLNPAERAYLRVEQLAGAEIETQRSLEAVSPKYTLELIRVKEAQERIETLERYASKKNADPATDLVRPSQADVIAAKKFLKETLIPAPFPGLITARFVKEGPQEFITPKSALLKLADYRRVKIKAPIAAPDFLKVQEGMAAEIRLDAFPGEIFPGRVTRMVPASDPASNGRVELEIPNPQLRLKSKWVADIRLVGRNQEVLTIAQENLLVDPGTGDFYAFVAEGDQAVRRRLTLGEKRGALFEVLEGLQEGDLVVVKGSNNLQAGAKIKITKEISKDIP